MSYRITRIGDCCDHGAVVITGDNTRIVDGRPVARIGDLVSCPIPLHGVNPIVAQTARIVVTSGKTTSHIASVTACGATLVTGSGSTIIDH
jgi:uncharacterized Zn-binding protein involved in type VI secretion